MKFEFFKVKKTFNVSQIESRSQSSFNSFFKLHQMNIYNFCLKIFNLRFIFSFQFENKQMIELRFK